LEADFFFFEKKGRNRTLIGIGGADRKWILLVTWIRNGTQIGAEGADWKRIFYFFF
jgi:hypothetical protein